MTNDDNQFRADWESFACSVRGRDEQNDGWLEKSSMWKDLITHFGVRDYSQDDVTLFADNILRSYNLLSKRQESLGFHMKKTVLSMSYTLARAASYFRNRVLAVNSAGLGSGHLIYYPSGIRWLKKMGLYADYEKFCNNFQMSLSGINSIKSHYISSIIAPSISGIRDPTILEIGGGVGTLAAMIYFKYCPSHYVIVDLPEMLLHSSLTLKALYPDVPTHFVYTPSADASFREDGLYFVTPDCVDSLKPDSVDCALNIDSFQEMTSHQVAQYIRVVQAVVKHDGYFFNLNRRKYLEVEDFDNNPLLYPYDSHNRIVRWETDVFMAEVVNLHQGRRDGWIFRLEQIRK